MVATRGLVDRLGSLKTRPNTICLSHYSQLCSMNSKTYQADVAALGVSRFGSSSCCCLECSLYESLAQQLARFELQPSSLSARSLSMDRLVGGFSRAFAFRKSSHVH